MKSMCVCNSVYKGRKALTTNFRKLRKVFGLVIAAIGLSASIASAVNVPVINGNFETEYASNTDRTINWFRLTAWTHENTLIGSVPTNGAFSSSADGGSKFTRFTWNDAGAEQNLNRTVAIGDTLSVTFNFGRAINRWGGSDNKGVAYFKIGSQYYYQDCDVSSQTAGTWKSFTFTTTALNAGALILGFRVARTTANNQYVSLDGVSDVTLTPAVIDPNAPTSTGATLAALENTETALSAGDFGYADPNLSPLAAVQITSLPALGTLKNGGATVVSGDLPLTVAAANIGNLTYLSPLGGFGTAYTTMLIKVQNSATPTGLWSLPATMTVNVTHVNHAPTSTGGSVVLNTNTIKTFASADFPFADVDAGDTFGAIKVVTSLPANGTLKLNGTDITAVPSAAIPVANIGTLTYTPNSGYNGADSFKFQVRDASLFSADATMAISVTSDIIVQNGSFENPNVGSWWTNTGAPWTDNCGGYGRVPASVNSVPSAPGGGVWIANMNDGPNPANNNWPGNIITQPLGSRTLNAGDTLQMTLYLYRTSISGVLRVSFLDGATTLASQDIDTSTQTANTWKLYTFSQTILTGVTANLQLKFQNVGGKVSWLDMVSNVSVIPAPPRGTVIILW